MAKSKPKIPKETRRLTKAEAERLGVSHKAKRRVDKNLKRITKKTKLYTDRQIAEYKLGMKKEEYQQKHIKEFKLKEGGVSKHYENLSKAQFIKILKQSKTLLVSPAYYATSIRTTGRYSDKSTVWIYGGRWSAEDLYGYFSDKNNLAKQYHESYTPLGRYKIEGQPSKYGLIVYDEDTLSHKT